MIHRCFFKSLIIALLFSLGAQSLHAATVREVNPGLGKTTTNMPCVHSSAVDLIYCFGGRNMDTGEITDSILRVRAQEGFVGVSDAVTPQKVSALSCAEYEVNGNIYCFGGTTRVGSMPYVESIFEFNPTTDKVRLMQAELPTGRSGLSCEYSSQTKKIYCFGGFDGSYDKTKMRNGPYGKAYYPDSFSMIKQIVEYSPSTDSLKVMKAQLKTGVDDHSCEESSANGLIYCFGGQYADKLSNAIGAFDPAKDTYKVQKATLKHKADGTVCTDDEASGKMYCFGGSLSIDTEKYINTIQEFDPKKSKIIVLKEKTPTKLAGHTCLSDSDGSIYCFGGTQSLSLKFSK